MRDLGAIWGRVIWAPVGLPGLCESAGFGPCRHRPLHIHGKHARAKHTHPTRTRGARGARGAGFGRHFFRQSRAMFANEDAAYVLAYGIIMLNTDLHNNQVCVCVCVCVFADVLPPTPLPTAPPRSTRACAARPGAREKLHKVQLPNRHCTHTHTHTRR